MGYRLRVKICGITREEDLDATVAAGADAVGLNFHPPSPRYLTVERAQALLRRLPPFVEPVGVFVDQPLTALPALVAAIGSLRTVQVHGRAAECRSAFPLAYVPAFQVRHRDDVAALISYLEECTRLDALPAAVLVDGYAPGLAGGTGVVAPWQLLAELSLPVPLILAGGLTPDNVAQAVRQVRPYAVDVASGVEAAPGVKDADRVRRFIEAAREAAEW